MVQRQTGSGSSGPDDDTGNPAALWHGDLRARCRLLPAGASKTDCSNRVIALPSFTAEALRRGLAIMADHSPDEDKLRANTSPD